MNTPKWGDVACGVPGYEMSSLKYAKRIQELINKGDFVTALFYLQDAKKAEMLHRMQFAIQENNLTKQYARQVQDLIVRGDFSSALDMLEEAKKAEMMHRLSFAIKEDEEKKRVFRPVNVECEEDYQNREW